jgi:hypothetical protein
VKLHLPEGLYQALQAHVERHRASMRVSVAAVIVWVVRQHLAGVLAEAERVRETMAHELVHQFEDAWRGFACASFRRLRGIVPLEELMSWSWEESLKAARRYDPDKGYSFASLLKSWLSKALRGFCEVRMADHGRVVYLDGTDDDKDPWESIAGEEPAATPDLKEALKAFGAQLGARDRHHLAKLLSGTAGRGSDGVRERLRAYLTERGLWQGDDEISISDAADTLGIRHKAIWKAAVGGKLFGAKRDGVWFVRESEVTALAREREVPGEFGPGIVTGRED